MILTSEAIQNLTTIAMPIILAIITLIVTMARFVKTISELVKGSNLENIKASIIANQDELKTQVQEVMEAFNSVMRENAELKKQNKEIKELLTKVKE